MAYSILEQFSRDIDWYVVNKSKHFMHVASAGGILPRLIEENDIKNEENHRAIMQMSQQFEIEINPLLSQILSFKEESELINYLPDFISMARKGFYSYDKTYLNENENTFYHIVAWPKVNVDIVCWSTLLHVDIEIPKQNLPFDLIALINNSYK